MDIDQQKLQSILAIIGAAAGVAGAAGVPYAGLVATLEPATAKFIKEIADHTGQSREEILNQLGIDIADEQKALLLDEAAQQ